jgi:hypothetical protein
MIILLIDQSKADYVTKPFSLFMYDAIIDQEKGDPIHI